MIELRSIEKLEDMILLDEQIFEQKMAIRQYIEAFRDTETSPSARHIFWQMASGKALNKGVLKLHATISAALPQLQDLTERSRVCGELQTCTAAIKYALMVAPTDGHWQRSAKKCGITNLPTVEYRNTLGTNRFNYPHDVAVAGSTIFVSDESKCLKMLSLDGKSLGLVSGINSPSGLYKTNLGIWACNRAERTLLLLNGSGKILKTIELPDETNADETRLFPNVAIPWNGGFSLLLSNQDKGKQRLAFLKNGVMTKTDIRTGFDQVNDIAVYNGRLTAMGRTPTSLLVDIDKNNPTLMLPDLLNQNTTRMTCDHSGGYLTNGNYLVRFDHNGVHQFWLNLNDFGPEGEAALFDVCTLAKGHDELVLVTDVRKRCIHVLQVNNVRNHASNQGKRA